MNKFLCEHCKKNYYSVVKDSTCPDCKIQMRNLTEEEYELNKVNKGNEDKEIVKVEVKGNKIKNAIRWLVKGYLKYKE